MIFAITFVISAEWTTVIAVGVVVATGVAIESVTPASVAEGELHRIGQVGRLLWNGSAGRDPRLSEGCSDMIRLGRPEEIRGVALGSAMRRRLARSAFLLELQRGIGADTSPPLRFASRLGSGRCMSGFVASLCSRTSAAARPK